jgi:hypothetical protein
MDGIWFVSCLICCGLVLTQASTGASNEEEAGSALAGVVGLDKPVMYSEAKIPLGELVSKVAVDTGVRLTAARDVADEPVAVVVNALPARQLLQELAALLDYHWSRRGREGAWRYEIWQDVASKQREEALRKALSSEMEKQFWQDVRQYIEIAALSSAQIQEMLEAERQQKTGEAADERRRLEIASVLSSPIRRALAGLLGHLSPNQWNLLREGSGITLSTDATQGTQPLPDETVRTFRANRPNEFPPDEVLFPGDPVAEERARRWEKEMQEQWATATDYRVTLRLELTPAATVGSSQGLFSLIAEGRARSSDGPRGSFLTGGVGTTLVVAARPLDFQTLQRTGEATPERRVALEKDPVLGAMKLFKPEAKSTLGDDRQARAPRWRLRDLLPELAHTYGLHFISDAYWNTSPSLDVPAAMTGPISLAALLDRSASFTHRWDCRGSLVRLRSRTWFLDRPREVPLRLVRRWTKLFAKEGGLSLEEYIKKVAPLNDGQIETLRLLVGELGLPPDFYSLASAIHVLRLYASLSQDQRRELWQGKALAVSRMTVAQHSLFAEALQQRGRYLPATLGAELLATCSFSLHAERLIRISEPGEGGRQYRDDTVTAAGDVSQQESEAARLQARTTKREAVRRQPITRVTFRFQYSSEMQDSVPITISSPTEDVSPKGRGR